MFLLKEFTNIKSYNNHCSLLTLTMIGLLIIYFWFIINTPNIENFVNKENNFTKYTDLDIYDKFYSDVYDNLYVNPKRNEFENKIIKICTNKKSNILDIGSGTGNSVSFCSEILNCNSIGVDLSHNMIKKSQEKFPNCKFKVLDINKSSLEFANEEFSTILCFYFTIYYFPNKYDFFKNCFKWLKPGGNLILHLVNVYKFDPSTNFHDGKTYESSDKNSIKVQTNNWNYKSKFIIEKNVKSNCNQKTPNAIFKEFFTFRSDNSVRMNEHKLYMPSQKDILSLALESGFILKSQNHMNNINLDYQYIYVLEKPN